MGRRARSAGLVLCALLPAVVPAEAQQRIEWTPMNEPGVGGALSALAFHPVDSRRVLAAGDMLGAAYSEDGGESWQVTTGFVSWELADFTFHPNNPEEVWAGTMSGPHVSRDGGRTWELKREGFPPVSGGSYSTPIQKVLFDPANAKRLLAFGGSHRRWSSPGQPMWGVVWESLDGGENWSRLTRVGEGMNITSAVIDSASGRLYLSTYGDGAYRSDDGGATWSACGALPNPFAYQVALNPADANTLWAALDNARQGGAMTAGSIYKSNDGCASWLFSGKGLPQLVNNNDANQTSRYLAIAVAPSDPRRLYTADRSFAGSSLWRSDDGGDTWISILNYGNRGRWPVPYGTGPTADWIAVAAGDADLVLFGNQANIIGTSDGGQTFQDLGARLVSAERKHWMGRGFSGLVAVNFRFNPFRAGHAVFNAMDDGKVWTSDDDLASWWWAGPGVPSYGGGNDAVFAGADGSVIYTSFGQDTSFQGLAKSSDGGVSWTMLWGAERGLPARGSANNRARGVYAMASEPDNAWAVIGTKLYGATDGGATWTVLLDQPGLGWLAGSGRTVYAAATNGVYRSEDGRTFTLMEGSPREGWRLALDPNDAGTLYLTKWRRSAGSGLWRYRNNEWTRIHSDFYSYDVAVDPFDSARIALSTSDDPYHDVSGAKGVLLSDDGGATWRNESAGLAVLRTPVVRFDPHRRGRLVVGTAGRGYFVGWLKDEAAGQ